MLILTRRVGQTLMIGHEVTVTVLGVTGRGRPLGAMYTSRGAGSKSMPSH
jgi:hypothetical protein